MINKWIKSIFSLYKREEEREMKKLLKMLMLSILSVFLIAGFAMAYPFIEVEGYVNPYAATITDNLDGTSTVTNLQYTFNVTGSAGGAEMSLLSLEFEGDVFVSVDSLTFDQPIDWAVTQLTSPYGNIYELTRAGATGTTIGLYESLQFTVSLIINNNALTDPSLWDEGQICWGQSWTARDTLGGGDGGSTTPAPAPVPEPTTILLLGTGLLGLVGYNRKRFSKKS